MAKEKRLVKLVLQTVSQPAFKNRSMLEVIEQCMDVIDYDDSRTVDEIAALVHAAKSSPTAEDLEKKQLRQAQQQMDERAKILTEAPSGSDELEDWQPTFDTVASETHAWSKTLDTLDLLSEKMNAVQRDEVA